jgi:hypothetical protein
MLRALLAIALCSSLTALAVTANGAETDETTQSSAQAINPVVEWNRTLFRHSPHAGPTTCHVHATRSFASCTPQSMTQSTR